MSIIELFSMRLTSRHDISVFYFHESGDRYSVRTVCTIKLDPNKTIKTNMIIRFFLIKQIPVTVAREVN